ncbi:YbhB/YbcL family Raf kinase inhibitor-like protein [Natronomonas amylolytica]|uniref:YbhB/YbcL family Raf kinase inhibitor-like protein n=1 Tax=Natronomonas amylolytica TaxID=3108498 RepID=UPI00300B0DD5
MRRRALLATVGAAAVGGCTIGGEPPDRDGLSVRAPTFEDGTIPERYTCDGAGVSPPLLVEGLPGRTESVAIVGEWLQSIDPASGPSTIWLLWGLPPEDPLEVPENIASDPEPDAFAGAKQGRNDEGSVGYRSPCHESPDDNEYRFVVLALSEPPEVEAGAVRDTFDDATESTVVASTAIRATYNRF